jgi:hypothetical protein
MTAGDLIPAASVHPGDELIFTVVARLSGTTASSEADVPAASGFVIVTLAGPDGDVARTVIRTEHSACRLSANQMLAAA